MASQKLSRSWFERGWLAGTVALGLVAVSCTPDYVTGNTAPVNLYVDSVTSGGGKAVLDSDVRSGSDQNAKQTGPLFVCEDYALVNVEVQNKNPLPTTTSVASSVALDSYAVRYSRTDGRGVEGVDVPYRITGNLAVRVYSGAKAAVSVEVVRHQAKYEPPLSSIFQTSVLTVFAEITLYGKTAAGEQVSASGRLQINFADFGDNDTTCVVK